MVVHNSLSKKPSRGAPLEVGKEMRIELKSSRCPRRAAWALTRAGGDVGDVVEVLLMLLSRCHTFQKVGRW